MKTTSALALTVSAGLTGLAVAAEPYEMFRGACMGTTYAVKFAERPAAISLASLAVEIRDELERIERIFSLFRPDSELNRFNAAPSCTWVEVSNDLHSVTTRALELAEQTSGAFDPTVGPLVRLWRTGTISRDWSPPSSAAIAEARQRVGHHFVEVRSQPSAMRKLSVGIELDLNALVEGWAIDRVIALFSDRGIQNVLVELGGEFRGVGCRGDGLPWRVGIEDPRKTDACYATVILCNAALATSGDYRQAVTHHGRSYSHILDPRTGSPIRHNLTAVSVVAADAFTADGWSTALLVLGPTDGRRLAEREGLAASFVLRTPQDSSPSLTAAASGRIVLPHHHAPDQPQSFTTARWLPSSLLWAGLGGVVGILVVCRVAFIYATRGQQQRR